MLPKNVFITKKISNLQLNKLVSMSQAGKNLKYLRKLEVGRKKNLQLN